MEHGNGPFIDDTLPWFTLEFRHGHLHIFNGKITVDGRFHTENEVLNPMLFRVEQFSPGLFLGDTTIDISKELYHHLSTKWDMMGLYIDSGCGMMWDILVYWCIIFWFFWLIRTKNITRSTGTSSTYFAHQLMLISLGPRKSLDSHEFVQDFGVISHN